MASAAPDESSSRELTILLLGETGVGKSTWINGFANFILFPNFASAEGNPLHCIVPSSFTVTDENYKSKKVTVGQDINEVMDPGQSATQQPQSYVFNRNGYKVRLIDTPGIGDVRGVKQDTQNFECILDHISHLDSLHAICILLKPNNARLNIMFQYCIEELLTHLHKDACANIVFCFTNSRSTFYRPGDTLPPLTKLLEKNKNISIPLDRSTIYCMDNEAIRFLYATKNGITFSKEERENYAKSWDHSVKEINRLLDRAESSSPYPVQSILSLNTARKTILALGSPMAEVSRNIQLNISIQQAQIESVKNAEKSQEDLSQNLVHKTYEIRMHHLPEPRTICTSPKCVDHLEVDGFKETHYKSHCHTNCSAGRGNRFKILNIKGHKNLRRCSAFNSDGRCKRCDCSWKEHMKIIYETSLIEKEVADVEKQMELKYQETSIKKIAKFIEITGFFIDELKHEQKLITDASIEFAKFLRINAITPYNNAMDDYLAHFIHDERNKLVGPGGGNPYVLEGLIKMQADYRKQMETLDEAMKQNSCGPPLTPPELDQLIKTLYMMKHNGQRLMEMMETSISSADSCYTEKLVGHGFTTVTKRPRKRNKLVDELGRRNYSRKDDPSIWVKVMDGPVNHGQLKKTSLSKQPPPPPPKPIASPTFPSSPLEDTNYNDNGDHSNSSMTKLTEERASLVQDICKGTELRKIEAGKYQKRGNMTGTDGSGDSKDLLAQTLAMRRARIQDDDEDDEWN